MYVVARYLQPTMTGSFRELHSGRYSASWFYAARAPGNYKAEWNGPANDVKVDIVQNGKTVATTEGKIKDLQQPAPYDAVMIKTLQNNTKALDEIDFNHRSESLVLEGE